MRFPTAGIRRVAFRSTSLVAMASLALPALVRADPVETKPATRPADGIVLRADGVKGGDGKLIVVGEVRAVAGNPEAQPAPPAGNRIFLRADAPGGGEGQPMVFRIGEAPMMKLEKAAFLGLSTSPAQPVLRKQLQLPAGMGLVVDFVAEKSPAADAGLKQFDVVQKVDDQILVNPQQLAVLVRSHKPGDGVKLSIIRDGKPQTITVKLAEKELPPLEEMRFSDDERFDRVAPAPLPGAIGENPMHLRVRPAPGQDWPRLMAESMTMVRDDGKTRLTLTTKDGQKHLLAKDKDGKVLFDGPVDTKEQREKLPADLRDQLDKMTAIGSINLELDTGGKRAAKPTTQKE